MKIAHITDTHLSGSHPIFHLNWTLVRDMVRAAAPDLVIHTGDAAISDPDRVEDLAFARAQMDALGTPYLIVPGNHDIGDNPVQADWIKKQPKPCDDARRAAWRDAFGPDFWVETRGDWRFVGLNAQLFGTGLAAEAEQWAMLEDALSQPGRTVLVAHKPLYSQLDGADLPLTSIPEADTRRIEALLAGADAPLMLSGHLHRHKIVERGGVMRVWGASTAFVCSHQHMARRGGALRIGYQMVTLGETPAVAFAPAPDAITMDIASWLEPGGEGLGGILSRPSPLAVADG